MAEKLTEIELSGIQLHDTQPRVLKDPSYNILQANTYLGDLLERSSKEDDIETPYGLIHVAVQGDRSKPAILTYHDIGMNHVTCFQGFFNYSEMQPILRHFCVYHVNAPGQQEGAVPLTQSESAVKAKSVSSRKYVVESASLTTLLPRSGYPTMDQLAEMLVPVLQFYNIRAIIGFGVGAGANILSRLALAHPDRVDALFLINPTAGVTGWSEWAYQKLNTWYLKGGNITAFTEGYLLWHWFGKDTKDRNHDLVQVYKENIKAINPHNLAMFIDSYINRTDLGIIRNTDPLRKVKSLKCNIMLVAGTGSPHLDDSVNMYGRLDPVNSNWMKISDCGGMALEEQPTKVCEAFRLFLQGMGHVPALSQSKYVAARTAAHQEPLLDDPIRTASC
ncbi:protein NDRG3-like isoform X3 [Tubulanus polymorphus]|uniref:protein NDRG3-like isoform X3 n=1 Tax=Tubulanus polymorphus TaxID=672921 RepID=UPI003DA649A0